MTTRRTMVPATPAAADTMPSDSVLWLSSDDATESGGTLTGWPDQSPESQTVAIGVAPSVVTNQINSLPIVRFTGTEYLTVDALASVFSGDDLPFSLFVLAKVSSLAADRTAFSAGMSSSITSYMSVRARTSVNTWAMSRRGDDNVFGQSTATSYSVDTSTWSLIEHVFDGTNLTTYISGRRITETGAITAGSMTIDQVTIGCLRTSTNSVFFQGDIAEVILYDRAVTASERRGIEAYIVSKYAIDLGQSYYVSTSGDDTNSGMASTSPLATVAEGYGRLGTIGGTLYLEAPEATPIRETFDLNVARPIVFDKSGDPWHWYGTTAHTSGWNSEGGSVWSKAIASDPVAPIFITTVADGDFFAVCTNAGDITTPAAGTYGYSGGKVYIRLPSDQDPNSHTLEISTVLAPIRVSNDRSKPLTIKNGVVRGGRTGAIVGSRLGYGGVTILEDMTVQYANNNVAIQPEGGYSAMICRRVVSQKAANDGFNLHNNALLPSYMRLEDCTASYNGDEGASPHDATIMEIYGGTYSYNGSGGVAAIENSTLRIDGATFANNATAGSSLVEGGIYYADNASGYVKNTTTQNNDGPGLYVETVGNVTVDDLTSSGNTYSDTY